MYHFVKIVSKDKNSNWKEEAARWFCQQLNYKHYHEK